MDSAFSAVSAGLSRQALPRAMPASAVVAGARTQWRREELRPRGATRPLACACAVAAVLRAGQRRGGRQGRGRARTARQAVVAAVAAAAAAAKVAAFGSSVAGTVAGIKEAVDSRPPRVHASGRKPKVVVLGSGWGAATFVSGLSARDAQMYDITVVSPRNFFLYTPLLPACTMGSIEERSIVTPIRRLLSGKGDYLEAVCEQVDTKLKVVRCSRAGHPKSPTETGYDRFPLEDTDGKLTFLLEYDILVYAVGAQTNDFGCPGVKEHAFFFKEMPDARRIRDKVTELFEQASLPTTTEEEKRAWLSFVIVGGGPTGVEVAADLADFVTGDSADLYPKLREYVKIHLVNTGDNLLSTYDTTISETSKQVFEQKGVEVHAGYRVNEVTESDIKMKRKDGTVEVLEHGCCIWAAGITENKLTSQLKTSLVDRNEGINDFNVESLLAKDRGLITDEWLQVRGSTGSIFALGDAATVRHDRTLPFAEQLFRAADINDSGSLTMQNLRDLFKGAADEFPQLEEYADYLSARVSDEPRTNEISKVLGANLEREQQAFRKAWELTHQTVGDRTKKKGYDLIEADFKEVDVDSDMKIDLEEFRQLLRRIDANLQAFPPTAQVAAQQGKFLAGMFAEGKLDGALQGYQETATNASAFTYFHKGSLAYLGGGSAAFDLPLVGAVTGPAAGVAWKLYETSAQLSWKNRALVGLDWLREGLFGRDSSHI